MTRSSTMHPRIRELLQHLDDHRAALRQAVDEVPRELRERRPAPDRWSVADVLEHLALVETRIARVLVTRIAAAREAGIAAERETTAVLPTFDMARVVDRSHPLVAAEGARPREGLEADAAWAALERSRGAFREAVLAGNGLALGEIVHPHPFLGPLDLYQWIAFVGGHEARHAAQIRETAAALTGTA